MKIGLMTIYHVPNYGSVLQTYATQKLLEQMGHECVILDYQYPNEWHFKKGAKKMPKWRKYLQYLGLKPEHRKILKLNKFRKKYLCYSKKYINLDAMRFDDWNTFDSFIVGSDQVWNPRFLKADKAFMLSFVPDNKPRYSLASSFAQDVLPIELVTKYQKELSKFKAISVRELNGRNIINNQLKILKDIHICLDPTLLLSAEEWLNSVPRSNFIKKRPYILVYMLVYAFDPQPYIWEVVKYFKQKMNSDVIVLMGKVANTGIDMIDATDSSIPKFIDLFSNADLVITSSFHGTAFALNFGKPLISIVPNNSGDDRQSSVLNSLSAPSSIVQIGCPLSVINPHYDLQVVSLSLNKMREDNKKWIKNNILCGC